MIKNAVSFAFRIALFAFPRPWRRRFGREAAVDFEEGLHRHWRAGPAAGAVFAARAVLDALREGVRERGRRGRVLPGHGGRNDGGRERGRWTMMEGIGTDLRGAARSLWRSPGFAVAAVVILALGIGANATVFSALRMTVLAPAPFPEADRLVVVDLTVRRSQDRGFEPLTWSFPKFRSFLQMDDPPVDVAVGYANRSATLSGLGSPEVIGLELVTPGYFDLTGHPPALGRAFGPAEMDPSGEPRVAILSHGLWETHFGKDLDVLGRAITLNGQRLTVVGVAPEGFGGITGAARLWIPMTAAADIYSPFMIEEGGAHWFNVLGRLREGTTLGVARTRMVALGDAIEAAHPSNNPNRAYSASLRSLADVRVNPEAHASVIFLSIASALVLLVACANLSGLMLARARRRARDGAVRMAVGASRWRLVRASLVESLLVAACGGGAGLVVALGGTELLAWAWPRRFMSGGGASIRVADPSTLGVDGGVVTYLLAVVLLTALLVGVAPAVRVSGSGPRKWMNDGGRATRGKRRVLGLEGRSALVGAQIALALVLVVGAGLLGGTTLALLDVDEGFDRSRLLTFTYSIPSTNSRAAEPLQIHDAFLEALRRHEGVQDATFGCAPLRGHCITTRVDAIKDGAPIEPGEGLEIGVRMVDDGHFRVLGIPVIQGRVFDSRDGNDALPTIILNETAARDLFGEAPAVGRFMEVGVGSDDKEPMAEIVGIVGDVLYSRREDGVMAEAYFSYREFPENHANVTVRAVGEPAALLPDIRRIMEGIDPTLAIYRAETMDDLVTASIGDRRSTLALLALFAGVAMLLVAAGTWSIVAYSVADRRRELGLRLALGAKQEEVVRTVIDQGLKSSMVGIPLGIVLGLGASRLLEAVLWQTEPTDPVVYAGGSVLLFALVMMASWLPARRAARVDPVEALKAE